MTKATLDELDAQLRQAARLLDDSAKGVRDLGFNQRTNIRRIGEALMLIFEIQHEIYQKCPDLTPEHLKTDWGKKE